LLRAWFLNCLAAAKEIRNRSSQKASIQGGIRFSLKGEQIPEAQGFNPGYAPPKEMRPESGARTRCT
jgi:hypothetical protein